MHTITSIQKVRQTEEGTDLMIHIPKLQLQDMLMEKRIRQAEIRFDDGRTISIEQKMCIRDSINAAKTNEMLSELLHIKKEEEKKQNVLMWVLIVVAAVAAVAGIAYAVYRFFTPDYLEDFDEDFDDDYDDDFFDDEDEDEDDTEE